MEDFSLFSILKTFLKNQQIKVDFKELKFQLLSHPSYPSLHSVTGVLTHFNIDGIALKVPVNKETIEHLPEHFITIYKGDFAVATKTDRFVSLLTINKKKKVLTFDQFLEHWSGLVVGIEEQEELLKRPKPISKVFSILTYSITAIFVAALFLYSGPDSFGISHFVLSLAGIALSLLIVRHELGFQSAILNKFCNAGEATSCDAVLNSKGAQLFGFFKLSDISLVYFFGLALTWLISAQFQLSYFGIVMLSVLGIPITLFSIFYQSMVIKKWCPLCLGIVAVLWLQCCSLLLVEKPFNDMAFDFVNLAILFFGFLLSGSVWLFVRPLLEDKQNLTRLRIKHHKFKRNFELFNAMLGRKESIDTQIQDIIGREIVLGNVEAPLDIMVVTSPGCFYCKAAHAELEKILDQNQDKLKLTVRFNVGIENQKYTGYRVASRLLEVYNTISAEHCKEAMHEVYLDNADFDKWLLKWGEPQSSAAFDAVLVAQRNWCHENDTNFTPAIFVNGHPFPKEYERNDLAFFVEDLTEEMEMGNEAEETTILETS